MQLPVMLRNAVKRFAMGSGLCMWCGAARSRLYDYLFPGALDYRLDRPEKGFCNLSCCKAYRF